jgi:predicted GTPase
MCVLSVRIELSNYSDIRELVVDGKPGFSPRGVSIIMGKSGSGKTLLANALYMEPVLTIADIVRKLG